MLDFNTPIYMTLGLRKTKDMSKRLFFTILIALFSIPLDAQSSVLDQANVYFPLDEPEGAKELVNNGTETSVFATLQQSGATIVPGVYDEDFGQVLYVNSDYQGPINLDDADGPYVGATGGEARTYAFWMKQENISFSDLLGSGSQVPFFKIQVQNDGAVRLVDESGNRLVAETKLTEDYWHHVAISVSENAHIQDVEMYIDGVKTGKVYVGTNAPINTSPSAIKLFSKVAHGWFSDFRFYDYALSEAEVRELFMFREAAREGIKNFDLNGFINDELDAGKTTIIVPPGKYKVPPLNNTTHLRFEGRDNVTIIADSVEMICSQTIQAIQIVNCNNFKIQGLSVDYDPLPFTQGEIVEISSDRTELTVDLIEGYEVDEVNTWLRNDKVEIFDAQTGELSSATYYNASFELDVPDQRVTVTKQARSDWSTGLEKVGDIVVLDVRSANHAGHSIRIQDCKDLLMENVTLYAGTTFGFFETNCNGSKYINCRVDRRPLGEDFKPRGMMRMRSNNADAFHSKHAEIGPSYVACTARYMGDDAFAINGHFHLITESNGNVLTVVAKGGGDNTLNLSVGDTVEMITYSGARVPNARIEHIEAGRPLTPEEVNFLTTQPFSGSADDTYTASKVYYVTIDREVDLPTGSLISAANRIGNGFEVRDCIVGPNRSRGILVKAGNGLITGNICLDNWGEAIKISPEYRWLEAGSGSNIVISNNTIRGCRQLGIGVYAFGGDGSTAPAGAHDNIQVFGNHISNSSNPAIAITSTTNLYFENNKITAPDNRLLLDRDRNHWGRLQDPARQIYYENVEFSENLAFNKPILVSASDLPSSNLVDNDLRTRWSAAAYPQSAEIDLGSVYDINRFDLYPFEGRDYQYIIELKSEEGAPYMSVVNQSANDAGGNVFGTDVRARGRYLKLTVTGANTYAGSLVELNELKVFGSLALVTSIINEKQSGYRIFPNPTSDTLNIMNDSEQTGGRIQVFDGSGRLVMTKQLSVGVNAIGLNGLPSGIYYLRIEQGARITMQRIMKK
jgi:hypothetical protein